MENDDLTNLSLRNCDLSIRHGDFTEETYAFKLANMGDSKLKSGTKQHLGFDRM